MTRRDAGVCWGCRIADEHRLIEAIRHVAVELNGRIANGTRAQRPRRLRAPSVRRRRAATRSRSSTPPCGRCSPSCPRGDPADASRDGSGIRRAAVLAPARRDALRRRARVRIAPGTVVTPLARDLLKRRGIAIQLAGIAGVRGDGRAANGGSRSSPTSGGLHALRRSLLDRRRPLDRTGAVARRRRRLDSGGRRAAARCW